MPDRPYGKIHPHPIEGAYRPRRPTGRLKATYAELHCRSNFSFLRGASHPDELVARAAELGYGALAITDRNSLAGVVRAHVAARQHDLHLVIGAEITSDDSPPVLLLAPNRAAYRRLARLITRGRLRAKKGDCELHFDDIAELGPGLRAIALPPTSIPRDAHAVTSLNEQLTAYRDVFGDDLHLAAPLAYDVPDEQRLEWLNALATATKIPLVATNDVHYHDPSRRFLQDVMTCIREKCTIDEAGKRLFPNAERHLRECPEIRRRYAAYPELLERGLEIAASCTFSLDELRFEYPHELCPDGLTPMEFLTRLTWSGARERYPDGLPAKVRGLLDTELRLIGELDYAYYFLTVWDLVRYARSRGILCQGRGSAANSAVCYCLGVTAVDPARIDLLFERFISRERNEPPDIDIDFEHNRREEVFQYIYQKYGRERAAITGEVITYRGRSSVRDVGKALGLSLDRVDRMAKAMEWWHDELPDDAIRNAGLDPHDRTVQCILRLVQQLTGFPRHLSQHVGGFVITESPLCEIVPLQNAAMPERTFIEWDKDDIEAVGMLKVDCLALGMLSALQGAFRLLNREEGTKGHRDEGKGKDEESEYDSLVSYVDCIARGMGDGEEDVSGFDCLAEGDRTGEKCVSRDQNVTVDRAFRPDDADAPGGGVGAEQHSRRQREGESKGIPALSTDSTRLVGRVGDPVRDLPGTTNDERCAGVDGTPDRNRPRSPGPDPQPPTPPDIAASSSQSSPLSSSFPSSLRPSVPSSLLSIPPEDPAVYDAICAADTVGVFQIESRAQMSMLPRLKPRCFYDLVIEVAIVRPGPIQGGMIHPYLRRRNGDEPVTYPDERIRDVLAKTLGVPLFQEQVMRLAVVAAGFTPGEADQLRRAMAAWKRSGDLNPFQMRLMKGMLANGYTREFAEVVFKQISGFAEYGFPESHAASFALLVYASAWIKLYHPAAFLAALINAQPLGFYTPAQLVADAIRHGVEVRGVDVNESTYDCQLEMKNRARSGSEGHIAVNRARSGSEGHIAESDEGTKRRSDEGNDKDRRSKPPSEPERERAGIFVVRMQNEECRMQNQGTRSGDVADSCIQPGCHAQASSAGMPQTTAPLTRHGRTGPAVRLGMRVVRGVSAEKVRGIEAAQREGPITSIRQLARRPDVSRDTLVRLAAADAFRSLGLNRREAFWRILALDHVQQGSLFADMEPAEPEPNLPAMSLQETVVHDYDAIGMSLNAHPIGLVRDELNRLKVSRNDVLRNSRPGQRISVAGLVTVRQRPMTAKGIVFMTLEDETGLANLILRPQVWDREGRKTRQKVAVIADGIIERQGEVIHVQVQRLHDLSERLVRLRDISRNFR